MLCLSKNPQQSFPQEDQAQDSFLEFHHVTREGEILPFIFSSRPVWGNHASFSNCNRPPSSTMFWNNFIIHHSLN